MAKRKPSFRDNYRFIDSALLNDQTYLDYLERFKKVALSMFEWVNLPKTMNAMYLEKCLYYYGSAALLKDEKYGFINTKCSTSDTINIYGLPNSLHCYSYKYQTNRKLYVGLNSNEDVETKQYNECILVQNDWDRIPTCRNYGTICL